MDDDKKKPSSDKQKEGSEDLPLNEDTKKSPFDDSESSESPFKEKPLSNPFDDPDENPVSPLKVLANPFDDEEDQYEDSSEDVGTMANTFGLQTFKLMNDLGFDDAGSEAQGDDVDQRSERQSTVTSKLPMGPPPKPGGSTTTTTTTSTSTPSTSTPLTTTTTTPSTKGGWQSTHASQPTGSRSLLGSSRDAKTATPTTTSAQTTIPTSTSAPKIGGTTIPSTGPLDPARNRGGSLASSEPRTKAVETTHVRSSSLDTPQKKATNIVRKQFLDEVNSTFCTIWPDYFDQKKPVMGMEDFNEKITKLEASNEAVLQDHFITVYRQHVICCVLTEMQELAGIVADAESTKKVQQLLLGPMADCRSSIKYAKKRSDWAKNGSAVLAEERSKFKDQVRNAVAVAYWDLCVVQCETATRSELKRSLQFSVRDIRQGMFRSQTPEVKIINCWLRFYMPPFPQRCFDAMLPVQKTFDSKKANGTAASWLEHYPEIEAPMRLAIDSLCTYVFKTRYPTKVACILGMQIAVAKELYKDAENDGTFTLVGPALQSHLLSVGWGIAAAVFLNVNGVTPFISDVARFNEKQRAFLSGVLQFFLKILNVAVEPDQELTLKHPASKEFMAFLKEKIRLASAFLIEQANEGKTQWEKEKKFKKT